MLSDKFLERMEEIRRLAYLDMFGEKPIGEPCKELEKALYYRLLERKNGVKLIRELLLTMSPKCAHLLKYCQTPVLKMSVSGGLAQTFEGLSRHLAMSTQVLKFNYLKAYPMDILVPFIEAFQNLKVMKFRMSGEGNNFFCL